MQFWQDWALWLKLVFVLCILIGLTVIAGVIKLCYDQLELKKHTRIEREKAEQQQPMVEDFVVQRRGRHDITPFGVRAIESGIEVEGVWISRGNSPASSAPGSPMLSPEAKGKAASRSSEIPSLQIPDQTHPYQNASRSANSSTGSFERATSAEKLDSLSGASELSPVPRSTYKPRQPSALRYSTADDLEAGRVPLRSDSGSSQTSSEGSNASHQYLSPANYQPVKEATYYRPTGMEHYNSGRSSPQIARATPDYVQPGRSNRSSMAVQNYTHGVSEPQQQQPPTPQRFHNLTDPQSATSDTFIHSPVASNRSHPGSRSSFVLGEAIELTDNPSMGNIPADKTKRVTRKLQKKTPGS